jgi:hypothetical protein
MGVIYVVTTMGMFFNPALRGMDVRREPVAEPPTQDGETMISSRKTEVH